MMLILVLLNPFIFFYNKKNIVESNQLRSGKANLPGSTLFSTSIEYGNLLVCNIKKGRQAMDRSSENVCL